MTQPPKQPRNRRADRYLLEEQQEPHVVAGQAHVKVNGGDGAARPRVPQTRPVDVTPQKQARSAQPRQAIGRSAQLQARQEQMRLEEEARRSVPVRRTSGSYSDFEVPPVTYPQQIRKKRRSSHTALWFCVALICLTCSGALWLFAAPQVMNVSFDTESNVAFVNGSVIVKDQSAIDAFNMNVLALETSKIHNGVYIDGVHVGGMTREQAEQALIGVPGPMGSSQFSINVNVEGYVWTISSQNVPLYRNLSEVVTQAYAVGRGNTSAIRGTTITPFQQRMNSVMDTLSRPVALYTQTTYDKQVVRGICDSIAEAINREPVNASVAAFDPATKRFTFNADESGVFVDAEEIYQAVTSWLDGGVYSGTVHVTPQVLLAQVTKAELMNRFGLISSFTTKKTGNTNRTTNIALSAEAISGKTLLPGETFSFNRATGERTSAKGYKPAAVIAGGETVDEIGGGVCQTSSTLFNAVVRANLETVSRKPHAWPSDYVPKGEDATVNWPNLDFKFKNNTDWPIFIVANCDKSNKTVTVDIYGMSLGDGVSIDLESEVVYKKDPPSETLYVYNPSLEYGTEKQTIKARTGYRVETYKVFYQNGVEISREKLHTSEYKMYQKTVEHNKPYQYGE